eukprot:7963996-Pyramimonas_sp.AAC.1
MVRWSDRCGRCGGGRGGTDMVLWGMKRAVYAAIQAQHDSNLEKVLEVIPRMARLPKVELQK